MNKKLIYRIDDFSLENDDLILAETIFHNANGYIGVRAAFEEGYEEGFDSIRGSYINGFYDFAEMKQAEKLYGLPEEKQTMLNVADTQGIRLLVDGEVFSMFEGTVLSSSRSLHMEAGYTVREVVWRSPKGKEIQIEIKRMASFHFLPLFTIEYRVKALNFSGKAEICSTHKGDVMNYCNPNDPRVAGESFCHLHPLQAEIKDGISCLTTKTSASDLTICTAVCHKLPAGAVTDVKKEGHSVHFQIEVDLREGEEISVEKYSVFSDSLRYGDCRGFAEKEMHRLMEIPLSEHYRLQKEYMDDFWKKSAMEIDGDDDLSRAVCYNLYQLIQSVGKDAHSNMAAKGLSGEGYEGHYFWDTEMYIQPFFTLTNPEISRNLIGYRYGILDAARDNARIMGHQSGALYPWRTIMGKECSGYFPSGSAQYHINSDVAYAVISYYLATGDLDLMEEKGAEILLETARLWLDTGNYYEGTFQIHDVTGPDEYTCIVNNNYYTNLSAKYNLQWAVKIYEMLKAQGRADRLKEKINLKEEEIAAFEQAAQAMYLPYDEKLGINPQDDSFLKKSVWDIENTPKDKFPLLLHYHPLHLYRHQVCKQADTVLAHFLFEDAQSLETIKNSFLYYEKVTTHDSSLSTCIFSIVAAKLGMHEKAYDYFGDSAKLDLFNLHKNTKDGIHTANMGGNYMAIVYGFGGVRIKEDGLFLAPSLPEAWKGYSFRICYEGCGIQVKVDRAGVSLVLLDGEQKNVFLYGEAVTLTKEVPYEIQSNHL